MVYKTIWILMIGIINIHLSSIGFSATSSSQTGSTVANNGKNPAPVDADDSSSDQHSVTMSKNSLVALGIGGVALGGILGGSIVNNEKNKEIKKIKKIQEYTINNLNDSLKAQPKKVQSKLTEDFTHLYWSLGSQYREKTNELDNLIWKTRVVGQGIEEKQKDNPTEYTSKDDELLIFCKTFVEKAEAKKAEFSNKSFDTKKLHNKLIFKENYQEKIKNYGELISKQEAMQSEIFEYLQQIKKELGSRQQEMQEMEDHQLQLIIPDMQKDLQERAEKTQKLFFPSIAVAEEYQRQIKILRESTKESLDNKQKENLDSLEELIKRKKIKTEEILKARAKFEEQIPNLKTLEEVSELRRSFSENMESSKFYSLTYVEKKYTKALPPEMVDKLKEVYASIINEENKTGNNVLVDNYQPHLPAANAENFPSEIKRINEAEKTTERGKPAEPIILEKSEKPFQHVSQVIEKHPEHHLEKLVDSAAYPQRPEDPSKTHKSFK